ncbi:MAG: hypothetical protein IPO28_15225 [Holophagaceae bacterium]|nr:hypothetical protein [Holophagaceae bacterium]
MLVIEDGLTPHHGSMTYGAGVVAAKNCGRRQDRGSLPCAVASIAATYKKYPNAQGILPARLRRGPDQATWKHHRGHALRCGALATPSTSPASSR